MDSCPHLPNLMVMYIYATSTLGGGAVTGGSLRLTDGKPSPVVSPRLKEKLPQRQKVAK